MIDRHIADCWGGICGGRDVAGLDNDAARLKLEGEVMKVVDGQLLGSALDTDAAAFDARVLGLLTSQDLLLAWGAPPRVLKAAVDELDRMRKAGSLLPRPEHRD